MCPDAQVHGTRLGRELGRSSTTRPLESQVPASEHLGFRLRQSLRQNTFLTWDVQLGFVADALVGKWPPTVTSRSPANLF